MLVLTRKRGQDIVIQHQGKLITVRVNRIKNGEVRLAINAPDETPITRGKRRVKRRKGAA